MSDIKLNYTNEFDRRRSLIKNNNTENLSQTEINHNIIGLTIYLCSIMMLIVYLIKKNMHILATILIMNIDLVAIVLGFKGGPYGIWKHLYNPVDDTLYGFFSTTLINFVTLFGIGIVCFIYSTKKDIYNGLGKYIVAILVTYLIPGMFLVHNMNNFAEYLYDTYNFSNNIIYLTTIVFGFIFVTGVIGIEFVIFKNFINKIQIFLNILIKKYSLYKLK